MKDLIDLTNYNTYHPNKRWIKNFTDTELNSLKNKLPDDAINFLKQEGCAEWDNFFITVLPNEYHEILSDWGLKGDKCFVFMRTSLGSLIYSYKGEYFSVSPFSGELCEFGDNFDLLVNGYLIAPIIIGGYMWHNHFVAHCKSLPVLNEDEIYAIEPTIPEGGSPETSNYVVVKLKEHLHKLAKQFDHKLEI